MFIGHCPYGNNRLLPGLLYISLFFRRIRIIIVKVRKIAKKVLRAWIAYSIATVLYLVGSMDDNGIGALLQVSGITIALLGVVSWWRTMSKTNKPEGY